MTLPLDQIVAELNNIGVGFQEANQLNDALSIYRDAAHAMNELLNVTQNDIVGHEEQDKLGERWKKTLMEWSGKVKGRNDNTVPTTAFNNLHVVAPYGQDTSSLTKAHRIGINEQSRELTSMILVYNMALVNSQLGAFKESLKLFQLALSLIPNELDQTSTASLACIAAQFNFGLLLNKLDRRNEAMEMLVDAAEVGGALLGDHHVLVANALNSLGQILSEEGDAWQAMEAFRLVATIYDRHDILIAELSSQHDEMGDSLAPAA